SAIPGLHDAILYLVQILAHHIEEVADATHLAVAIPQQVIFSLSQLHHRFMNGKIELCGIAYKGMLPFAHLLTFPTGYSAFIYTQSCIGNNQVFINSQHLTETFTLGTGSVRIIEGK